ncbi:MAG TPA: YqaA family protein [Castellaniella sp.]|uniref:YqaA family protein n=1 Tax=Castellaniella sp. TaxID=1955812 RepID=UPI002EE57EC9
MEAWVQASIHALLAVFALPAVGLPAIFVICLVSATLLPLGSEPAVFAYVQLTPHMFWPAIAVATVGNTIGGVITYAMGAGAETAFQAWRHHAATTVSAEPPGERHHGGELLHPDAEPRQAPGGRWHKLTLSWFQRFGPPALLVSWLPGIGDPLCAVAGWLKLPFWPCVLYMAIGKCLRYIAMTIALLHAWPWVNQWL